MKQINQKLWQEFVRWGSGFNLEAERDYQTKGDPLIFHLKMYGLWTDDENEYVSRDLNVCMREAIKEMKKNKKIFEKHHAS